MEAEVMIISITAVVVNIGILILSVFVARKSRKVLGCIREYQSQDVKMLPSGREKRRVEAEVLIRRLERKQARQPSDHTSYLERNGWDSAFSAVRSIVEEWAEGEDV